MDAATLAVEQINSHGGIDGRNLELKIVDNQSTPMGALKAYSELIDQAKVTAVIAPAKSAQIVAMIPKANSSQVPTIIGGTSPRLSEGNRWFFRARPDDRIAASAMVDYIADNLHLKKIAVINDSGAFGVGGANLVEKYAKDRGLEIVKRETFASGEKDFQPYLEPILLSGAEIMISYVPNYVDQAVLEIARVKHTPSLKFFGSPASTSNFALEVAKSAAEGIYAVNDYVMGETPESSEYRKSYLARFKQEPDSQSGYAYDGIMILAQALRAERSDPEKIRAQILKLKDYKGVVGRYTFDSNGDGLHSVSVVQVKDGHVKRLQ